MKRITSVLFVLAVFLVSAKDLDACLCGEATLQECVKGADIVFVGKVREVIDLSVKARTEVISSGDPVFAVVDILKSWKGIKEQRAVIIRTVRGGTACGVEFKTGNEYLVFAKYDKAMVPLIFLLGDDEALEFHKSHHVFFETNVCMGTTIALESEIKKLGKPRFVNKP